MNIDGYNQTAALVRISALNTAGRLMEVGQPKPEGRFMVLTEEFLAFYTMMACRFIYMVYEIKEADKVETYYESIRSALRSKLNDKIHSVMDSYKVDDTMEYMVGKLAYEDSFNNAFWALWKADLDSLRITLSYLGELAKAGMTMPSEDKTDIACFAMIIRSARYCFLENTKIPPVELINECSKVFLDEGSKFNETINIILLNQFNRSR